MNPKSFLFALAIFSGGYLSNTLLDEAVDRAEKYLQIKTSTYKTDSDGYIICSPEKPKTKVPNLIIDAQPLNPAQWTWPTAYRCFGAAPVDLKVVI